MTVTEIRKKMNKLSADHRYYAGLLGRATRHTSVRDLVILDLEKHGPSDARAVANRVVKRVKTRLVPVSRVFNELSKLKNDGIVEAVKGATTNATGRRCKAYLLTGGGK